MANLTAAAKQLRLHHLGWKSARVWQLSTGTERQRNLSTKAASSFNRSKSVSTAANYFHSAARIPPGKSKRQHAQRMKNVLQTLLNLLPGTCRHEIRMGMQHKPSVWQQLHLVADRSNCPTRGTSNAKAVNFHLSHGPIVRQLRAPRKGPVPQQETYAMNASTRMITHGSSQNI